VALVVVCKKLELGHAGLGPHVPVPAFCILLSVVSDDPNLRRPAPQEDFLERIDDDEAVAIVRRCLIPTDRLQLGAEIGQGRLRYRPTLPIAFQIDTMNVERARANVV